VVLFLLFLLLPIDVQTVQAGQEGVHNAPFRSDNQRIIHKDIRIKVDIFNSVRGTLPSREGGKGRLRGF
jgi:hypothetical protein